MTESNTGVEPTTQPPNPANENADPVDLEEFLAAFGEDDDTGEAGQNPADGDKPAAKPKPTDLKSLAEQLGVEVKDLYDLQIPSRQEGKEPWSLGKLKDLAAEHDEFTLRTLRFDEESRTKEAELTRSQGELHELWAALPPAALKPEVLEKAREKYETRLKTERNRTLEVIPEWRDDAVMKREREALAEHLEGYGFPKGYLESIYDHRTLKYIRANWQRETRLKAALERIKPRKQKTPSRSTPTTPRKGNGQFTHQASGQDAEAAAFLAALNNG